MSKPEPEAVTENKKFCNVLIEKINKLLYGDIDFIHTHINEYFKDLYISLESIENWTM